MVEVLIRSNTNLKVVRKGKIASHSLIEIVKENIKKFMWIGNRYL